MLSYTMLAILLLALSPMTRALPATPTATPRTFTFSPASYPDSTPFINAAIPAYTPVVTAAPSQDEQLASQGYAQTTYYTCETLAGQRSCGWHVPIVKVDEGAAAGPRVDEAAVGAVVGAVAAVFVLGML